MLASARAAEDESSLFALATARVAVEEKSCRLAQATAREAVEVNPAYLCWLQLGQL